MHRAHLMTGGRYPVLRAMGILYLLGAAAVFLYGLYWVGWTLFAAPAALGERFNLMLQAIAATFFAVITILALAELIKLVIDIEHNTRMAAMNRTAAETAPGAMPMVTPTGSILPAGGDGHVNRMAHLDEESAEAALLRGH